MEAAPEDSMGHAPTPEAPTDAAPETASSVAPTGVDSALVERIAIVAHEANRAYCATQGDDSQVPWEEAPAWQRHSAEMGVRGILDGSIASPRESHESWTREKLHDGWTYGPAKDAEAKTHPCLVPYTDLPESQQKKDALFFAVVSALR